ncbi:MAG TPA: serine/threonine-protein kinase [Candidatus Acidoferrales bacterium]|nr:serine/threonine-protein kinase [Candidatus Acidoferrales bacterium]
MAQPETIGRYKIVSELGHGAMGAVYRAVDPMMDRTVAIKTILAGALAGPQAQEYRDRFVREARAAGRLQHPGIVTVYDVGEADGIPYLVMEFVNGRTLATAMESGERFSFDRVYEMGYQVADALGYAHRHGVVHRDIKPANILLAVDAEGGVERAKIADLGVAKLAAAQITTTGQLLGTPAFMPPEQFTGAPLDGRADIFSLGVILYWLATGDKPFGGDTITAVSYKVVHSMPAPPRRINPAVPAQMERIILRCLEKDPEQRYAKAEQLAADLAAARAGREVSSTATITAAGAAAATQTAMAPVTMIDGDPNTTLDSSVRLEMMKRAPMRASMQSSSMGTAETMQTPAPVRAAKPGLNWRDRKVWALAMVFVLLVFIIFARHRKTSDIGDQIAKNVTNQVVQQTQAVIQQQASQAAPDPNAASANGQPSGASATGGAPSSSSDPGGSSSAGASGASHASPMLTPTSAGSAPPATPNIDSRSATNPASSPSTAKQAGRRGASQTATKNNGAVSSAQQGKQQSGGPASLPSTLPLPPTSGANGSGGGANAASQILEKPPTPTTPPATNANSAALPTAAVAKPTGADAENAGRLHVDDGRVPNSVSFLVLLDGKRLLQRGVLAEGQNSPAKDDLLIEPGEHEIKVIALVGGVAIGESNTVKQDFKSKKKKALRIELRDNSSGQMLKKTSTVVANSSVFVIELRDSGGFLGVH